MNPDEFAEFMASEMRAYVNAIRTSLIALIDDRTKALPAPTQGAKGETGEKGEAGAPGRDGESTRGEKGERGERGLDGRDARDGRDGKDGITEERLEKAVAQMEERTAERVINSIHLDGRELKVGDRVLRVLPIPEYRDVYRDGEAYEPGDIVSWGGSGWICKAPTTDKPGDGSPAWRLFVKRGRDAREPERVRA